MEHAPQDGERAAEEGRAAPWGWIYAAVAAFTVLVVLGLWAFSRYFTP
jgi:hypothetical protein